MTKYQKYQDYVIKDGEFIGEFEQMYKDFDDPWKQNMKSEYKSTNVVALNLIKKYNRKRVLEIGCGFGYLTEQIRMSDSSREVLGIDISETAIRKAQSLYPQCNFSVGEFDDFDLIKSFNPDCIFLAEITWYVLDKLDKFLEFLKTNFPECLINHLLSVYDSNTQQYGKEKFTNLQEIMSYFNLVYYEWGECRSIRPHDERNTYFIGSVRDLDNI